MFMTDKAADQPVSLQTLLSIAGNGQELTFLGVPVGSGRRLGIDNNNNGVLDGDE
jgi:hypothetical protein